MTRLTHAVHGRLPATDIAQGPAITPCSTFPTRMLAYGVDPVIEVE